MIRTIFNMECFVCLRSMSELKRLIDLDDEAKQIFLLISDVSHIKKNDYLCKVCLSLLQAASAFREVCAMSDLCFSRRKQAIALTEDPQDTEYFKSTNEPPPATDFIKVEQDDNQDTEDLQFGKDDDSDFNYPGGDNDDDWEMSQETQSKKMKTESTGSACYTCDICGKTFKVLRSLQRHLIQTHKRPDPRESYSNVTVLDESGNPGRFLSISIC